MGPHEDQVNPCNVPCACLCPLARLAPHRSLRQLACKLSAGPGAPACMHAVNKGAVAHLPLGNSEVMRAVCGSVMFMLAIGEAGLLRLCSTLSSRVWRSTTSGNTLPACDVDTCMSSTALCSRRPGHMRPKMSTTAIPAQTCQKSFAGHYAQLIVTNMRHSVLPALQGQLPGADKRTVDIAAPCRSPPDVAPSKLNQILRWGRPC
jgi:hypothetical protein